MLATWAATHGSAAPPLLPAPFAKINGPTDGPLAGYYESWSADYAGTPSISTPVAFSLTRPGYTATASGSANTTATTTYDDTVYVTSRVRQSYPNQGTLPGSPNWSANTVSLSEWAYVNDVVYGGAVNNSTYTSPLPICNWANLARSVVGNAISTDADPVEIVAFHRNARGGKQVCAVVFTVTDGSITLTSTVITPTLSARATDKHKVIVYRLPQVDITSLATGVITVNAKVYPWVGDASSVADSSAGSGRAFSPRYYLKDTALFAAPYYATIDSSGSAGGVFSTTPATADATPFDTVLNMFNALNSGAAGKADGVIVRGKSGGPFVLAGSATARNQNCAAIIFTRHPTISRATSLFTFGAAGFSPKLTANLTAPVTTGALRFFDVTVTSTGAQRITGDATNNLQLQWDDADFDAASRTTSINDANTPMYINGATFTNWAGGLNAASQGQQRLIRGLTVDLNGTGIDDYLLIGSDVREASAMSTGTVVTGSNTIVAFNFIRNQTAATDMLVGTLFGAPVGTAIVQNVFEYTRTTSGHQLAVSNDNAAFGNTHVVVHDNTFAGFDNYGRCNMFYDEGATAPNRFSLLMSVVGNIFTQYDTKGDVYQGTNQGNPHGFTPGSPSDYRGNFGPLYGCGFRDNAALFCEVGGVGVGGEAAIAYPGIGGMWGTSETVPLAAFNTFTNWQADIDAGSGATGGGTYTLEASSPFRTIVDDPVLSYTLDGVARTAANDCAGAMSKV